MIDLDLSQLPPNITKLLMTCGSHLPALQWHQGANNAALKTLEQLTDTDLLGVDPLKDEAMAGAVRALLLLWTGHLDACCMYAMAAPPAESNYLQGICKRQLGQAPDAKALLQQVQEHPVFELLAKYVATQSPKDAEPPVKRFADIVAMGQMWESFAYIDLFEQARAKQLTAGSEAIVRKFQGKEFSLLLLHCYQAATGIDLTQKKAPSTPPPRRREMPTTRNSPAAMQRQASARQSQRKQIEKSKPTEHKIACPKCKAVATFKSTDRGNKIPCGKCGAQFLIPGGSAGKSAAAPTRDVLKIKCPKCMTLHAFNKSVRGSKVKCKKCAVVFAIAA